MSSVVDKVASLAEFSEQSIGLSSLESFIESFPLQGDFLYATVFHRNSEIIQTQKAHLAIANLEKILTATFEVSATSGFDRMSLRDLSRQTGMSMGAIYSCINKKEDIAIMIADVVRLSSELTRQHALQSDSLWSSIEESIRYHLYASSVLQPWYFFLYFETRSLPEEQQRGSKQIELDGIDGFETHIRNGVEKGEFFTNNPRMVANTIVVLLEDWYLKPWKTMVPWKRDISIATREEQINNYHQSIVEQVRKLLAEE